MRIPPTLVLLALAGLVLSHDLSRLLLQRKLRMEDPQSLVYVLLDIITVHLW